MIVWMGLVIKFLHQLETNGVHKRGLTPRLLETDKSFCNVIERGCW